MAGLEIWGFRIARSRSYLSGGVPDFGFGDSGLEWEFALTAHILDFGFADSGLSYLLLD